jgi:hypothetical protein
VARSWYGIGFEHGERMMTQAPTTPSTTRRSLQRVLAWTFRRDAHFLTCELLCADDHAYAVIVTPHWPGGTERVEERPNGVTAFQRHATLALQLRQQGWNVVAYEPLSPRTPSPHAYPLAA